MTNNGMMHTVLHIVESDHQLTIDDTESEHCINISHESIHRILQVEGFRKICAYWVLWLLTADHCKQHLVTTLTFLIDYSQDLYILTCIVTDDETWIHYSKLNTKKQTILWKRADEPTPKKIENEEISEKG